MHRKDRAKRRGRPTKYCSAVARRICKAISQGCSRQAAAALAGISTSTLHEWRNEFPDFSDVLQKADAQFEAACIASIRKAGRNPRNWTANAWLLERKFPERYGKTDRHLVHTEGEDKPLPEEYKKAIAAALGYTGELKPLYASEVSLPASGNDSRQAGSGTIDLEVLPE